MTLTLKQNSYNTIINNNTNTYISNTTIAIIKINIIKFLFFIKKYCKKHNLPITLQHFLFHNGDTYYVSSTYKYLSLAPKYLLCASKSFQYYYNTLDTDFKKDIFKNDKEYKYYQNIVIHNKSLYMFLKKILKNDFLFNNKKYHLYT